MTEKPPAWADSVLIVWVLAVALFYFGGYFLPAQIGAYTQAGAGLYALMLLLAAGTLAFRYLRRAETQTKTDQTKTDQTKTDKDTRTENRK